MPANEPGGHFAKWNKPDTKGHYAKWKKIVWFHLSEVLRLVRFIETECRMVVARGSGRRDRELFSGYRVSDLKMKKFWTWMVVMVAQQCGCTSCHWILYLKMVKMVNFMLCMDTVKKTKQNKSHIRIFSSQGLCWW